MGGWICYALTIIAALSPLWLNHKGPWHFQHFSGQDEPRPEMIYNSAVAVR